MVGLSVTIGLVWLGWCGWADAIVLMFLLANLLLLLINYTGDLTRVDHSGE